MKDVFNSIYFESMKCNPREMNPIVLAYIGDAVYELFVRTHVIQTGAAKVNALHKLSVDFVKAESQAKALKSIECELNEDEASIVRRARNHKTASMPKNTTIKEYKLATAFEALLGYLYLRKNESRLKEIIVKSLEALDQT